MSKVIVVGGGAAGMMSAIWAARSGHQVVLYEKNDRLGKKIFITGKGRCNFTNACEDIEDLFNSVTTNRKFMYSSFYSFDNQTVLSFFEELGLKYKIERGDRAFPVSDHSSDVILALSKEMKRLGVEVILNSNITDLIVDNGVCKGIRLNNKDYLCDNVIVATGGISYPRTGSTGDGYEFAKKNGHSVTKLYPSLVPFNIKEEFCKDIMGLAMKNISISIKADNKEVYSDFGELLFTHFGVSGPVILSGSAYVHKYIDKKLMLYIDFKPALNDEQLDKRILRDFDKYINKQFKNALDDLLPKKLIPIVIDMSNISSDKKVNEITKQERLYLVNLLKNFPLTINSLRGYDEAIITKGGIAVKEIDPSTMKSKIVDNLYFCGEVLDVDALTGGYNLQIAWSTGYLAGISI